MDDFLLVYLSMMVLGGLVFIAFWGAVIYFAVRLFRSEHLSTAQKLGITSAVLGQYPGQRGPYEPGPVESDIRGLAAREGIDLDR